MSHVVFPKLGLDLMMNRAAFSIFNKDIYWYGIIIAIGFALAVLYAMSHAKEFGLTGDQVVDYLIWGTIFAIIGARLYYVIFSFDSYKDNPLSILYIWEGGIAIYGAVIGAFATGFVISKIKKLNWYKIYDLAAIGFLIGQIIGRWGNFVNAEADGKAFESQNIADLPFWAMGIGLQNVTYVHPIFLYESLWNLVGLLIVLLIVKPHISFGGEILVFYMGWYGFGRFFTEGLRGGDELYLFSTNIRVSQMLSVLLFLTSVAIFIWKFTHKEKTGPFGMSKVTVFLKGTTMLRKVPYLYPEAVAEEEEEGAEEENAGTESGEAPEDEDETVTEEVSEEVSGSEEEPETDEAPEGEEVPDTEEAAEAEEIPDISEDEGSGETDGEEPEGPDPLETETVKEPDREEPAGESPAPEEETK